jgi:hypothetical protein
MKTILHLKRTSFKKLLMPKFWGTARKKDLKIITTR